MDQKEIYELLAEKLGAGALGFNEDGVEFDLPEERKRLETWLEENDAEGVTNRVRMTTDVDHIAHYNGLSKADGGRADQVNFLWYPHKIGPSYRDKTRCPPLIGIERLKARRGQWKPTDSERFERLKSEKKSR